MIKKKKSNDTVAKIAVPCLYLLILSPDPQSNVFIRFFFWYLLYIITFIFDSIVLIGYDEQEVVTSAFKAWQMVGDNLLKYLGAWGHLSKVSGHSVIWGMSSK